jgi:cell division protein FtsA
MDTRIGYPNEHLSGSSDVEMSSPSFATAVGLLMKGLNQKSKESLAETEDELLSDGSGSTEKSSSKTMIDRKSIFEKWADKFREFLDNAE